MRWYQDNGKLAVLMIGAIVLIFIMFVAGCHACVQFFWNVGNSPEEIRLQDSIQALEK